MFIRPFFCLFLAFSLAFAADCLSELRAVRPEAELAAQTSSRDLLHYLRTSVNLLEPVLPPFAEWVEVPLDANDPDYETALFLSERNALPTSWQEGALELSTLREALERLADWYGLEGAAFLPENLTKAQVTLALATLIEAAIPEKTPVMLVATEESDANRVAFWSVIRNEGIFPRMIVVRPPEASLDLAGRVQNALPLLATCAMPLNSYISAPAETARTMFLANTDAAMYIATSDDPSFGYMIPVPQGLEPDYFTFRDPSLNDASRYAAMFYGPPPSILTITRLLPRVRTNMNPQQILNFLMQ